MTGPPDLDACAREPIHIPGSIQPHGVLLVVDPADGRVLQASANASAVLTDGVGRVTGEQFGALVQVDPGQAAWLRPTEGVAHVPAAPCTLVQTGDIGWNAVWHLYPRHWLLELEPARGASSLALTDALRAQRQTDRAGSIALAAHHAAAEIRALTGYGRVMVYRFDEHWHGDVIAEVHRAGLESYLGLHYPASDIPVQARALYLRMRVRQIVDVGYVPVPIEPLLDPRDGQPVDLSDVAVRSVSPVHCEYLANMGVAATLVASLVVNNQLWGLVACHHYQPRFIDAPLRDACEAISQALAARVGSLAAIERLADEEVLLTVREKLITAFSEAEAFTPEILDGLAPHLIDVVDADGVAVFHGDRVSRHGALPDEASLARIREAMEAAAPARAGDATGVLHVDAIGEAFPQLADLAPDAAGLVYVPLAPKARSALLWTRREQVRTVNWAGNPTLSKLADIPGARRSPRKSFELWQDIVRGRARPWSPLHLESARSLRLLIELMERKRDRQDLALMEATLTRMRHGVAIIERAGSPATSRLAFANPAFARASGFGTTALIGQALASLEPVLSASMAAARVEQRLGENRAFGECLPLQGDDGVLRDWLFEFEPLQAGDDAQHWLLQLREADPRPEGGR